MLIDFIGLFFLLAGFIIGLGAVTIIDIHGFLGRKSSYWTEATTRTHKVTKPLIWIGTFLVIFGGAIFFRESNFSGPKLYLSLIAFVLVLNGLFLSFKVSPYLLEREKIGAEKELLPESWQRRIFFSFIVSDVGWWGAFVIVVYHILLK